MSLNSVLQYWFGEICETPQYLAERNRVWFKKSAKVDAEIKLQFTEELARAGRGEMASWAVTPRGRLALVVLLDQFSRHVYRNKPESFAQDPLALLLTLEGLDGNIDQLLHPIERRMFYLPLEHAESLEIQKKSVAHFSQLVVQSSEALKADAEDKLTYAVRHYEIIERFGRFPHRNTILGRQSTDEEIQFLKQPNSSF